ncbi:tetratricopeptide repeat protein [Candidatus Entotheonella palauensis]|uniref:tetratricopeptide repeat protein n=1 Tax=Candidatus Entotheonella palauensis TaxID=93172 RepID=UPI000B7D0CE7|nr:tetratricopeptide repeat protein [Candidatus Entotheonella palauensis]
MSIRDWWYTALTLMLFVLLWGDEVYGQSRTACRTPSKPLQVSDRTWWRYYQRGIIYVEHECWQEAVQDFEAAIAQRPRDAHRARTQGLRFIAYYPHRELGIAYYHLGRYAEAIRELKTSLEHTTKQNEKAEAYVLRAQQSLADRPASFQAAGKPCKVPRQPLVDFNWWNYYQRGTDYVEHECWREAVKDFQAAIAQRPRDAHRARTFGLRFVDYFPHRELGIVYYHLGQYPEAVRELEMSLDHVAEKNERTAEFLNRARLGKERQTC